MIRFIAALILWLFNGFDGDNTKLFADKDVLPCYGRSYSCVGSGQKLNKVGINIRSIGSIPGNECQRRRNPRHRLPLWLPVQACNYWRCCLGLQWPFL